MIQDVKRMVVADNAEAFVSTIPWLDEEPDCLVLSCSDHRFEAHVRDLAHHLGYENPHVVQLPGGAALTLPLAAAFNFLSKALDKVVERIVEMKRLKRIVLVAHGGCGAYKTAGHHSLLDSIAKITVNKSVRDVQIEHLRQAARRIRSGVHGVEVRTFIAEAVNGRVHFTEVV